MPQAASVQAADTDAIFDFIMWVTIFFTVLVAVLMTWFLIRYRARSDDEPDPTGLATHSTTLELTWTVIPTCIVLVMFTLGFRGYLNDTIAPPNAYTVNVTGASWYWNFKYPNGAITTDLHLPKDRAVKFVLHSTDVLHSLYIPAFRLKKDVVPGRYNQFWVEPNRAGVYELFCTEYCGTSHSQMVAKCFVYEPEDYDTMLAKISNLYVDFAPASPSPRRRSATPCGRRGGAWAVTASTAAPAPGRHGATCGTNRTTRWPAARRCSWTRTTSARASTTRSGRSSRGTATRCSRTWGS